MIILQSFYNHYAECCYSIYSCAACSYAECHYTQFNYAECHHAECHYPRCHRAGCRGAPEIGVILPQTLDMDLA